MKREAEMFMKHHEMIKEERKRQSEETSKMVLKQMNEIDDIKRHMERESIEARRRRVDVWTQITLMYPNIFHDVLLSYISFLLLGGKYNFKRTTKITRKPS